MGRWDGGWDEWDDEDEDPDAHLDPEARAARAELRDAALAQAAKDVKMVKLLHLTMVLFGVAIFVVALLLV